MTDTLTPVLTAHWDEPDGFTIEGYRRTGGYRALAQALTTPQDDLIAAVKEAMTQEAQNRLSAIAEQKQSLGGALGSNAPGGQPPAKPGARHACGQCP